MSENHVNCIFQIPITNHKNLILLYIFMNIFTWIKHYHLLDLLLYINTNNATFSNNY